MTSKTISKLDRGIQCIENRNGIECQRCFDYFEDCKIMQDGKFRCKACRALVNHWLKSKFKSQAYKL